MVEEGAGQGARAGYGMTVRQKKFPTVGLPAVGNLLFVGVET